MKVTSPAGETVHVRRRWLPWRRRNDGKPKWDTADIPMGGDDIISMIVIGLVAVLVFPIVVGLLLFGIELLLLIALLPVFVLARIAFGMTWMIEVTSGHAWASTLLHAEKVKGWTDSGVRIHDLAVAIESGRALPQRS